MSFKKSGSSNIKSFVSEEEAQDINEKRQQEWERVRQPDDPLECPDVEPRSLFEQLQEQKEKTQQEHDEKYDIKKIFRGIDNDEAVFLEFASKQQAEIDGRRFAFTAEVKEFRNEVSKLQTVASPATSVTEEKKKPNVLLGKKKSQLELLAGCIKTKRKRSEADTSEDEKSDDKLLTTSPDKNPTTPSQVQNEDLSKKASPEDKKENSSLGNQKSNTSNEATVIDSTFSDNTTAVQQMGYIPSLGVYSDSSDSESSSSDSDILPSLFSNFTSKAK